MTLLDGENDHPYINIEQKSVPLSPWSQQQPLPQGMRKFTEKTSISEKIKRKNAKLMKNKHLFLRQNNQNIDVSMANHYISRDQTSTFCKLKLKMKKLQQKLNSFAQIDVSYRRNFLLDRRKINQSNLFKSHHSIQERKLLKNKENHRKCQLGLHFKENMQYASQKSVLKLYKSLQNSQRFRINTANAQKFLRKGQKVEGLMRININQLQNSKMKEILRSFQKLCR